MSEVYFTRFGASYFNDSIIKRLEKMFDRAGAGSVIKENELCAVKAHFGERGNVSFISPVYYRAIIDRIKICGGLPFIADTNTLYVGGRNNAVKHLETAAMHGFNSATLGVPVIIADGLRGTDFVDVEINQKHIKKAHIGSAFYWADSMIVLSHVKAHMMSGMGAAIKNLAMGCGSRAGKQEQHSGSNPLINEDKCTACGECISWCAFEAIEIGIKAAINAGKCSGCGECVAACKFDAIEPNWETDLPIMQEKMAEYALAAVYNKKGKVFYFNFIINVTPECDCAPSSGAYLIPDIGILGSFDPVAIDAASADLVNKAAAIDYNVNGIKEYDIAHKASDKFKMVHPETVWHIQLEHAERIGLGTRKYELIEI